MRHYDFDIVLFSLVVLQRTISIHLLNLQSFYCKKHCFLYDKLQTSLTGIRKQHKI